MSVEGNSAPGRLVGDADYARRWSTLWLQRRTIVKRRLFIVALLIGLLLLAALGAVVNIAGK